MARIAWTEPALSDLDAIADYIALENPRAAKALVERIFSHVAHLADHPEMGVAVPELPGSRYRQIIEPPCRIVYRYTPPDVYLLHVVRTDRRLSDAPLRARGRMRSR